MIIKSSRNTYLVPASLRISCFSLFHITVDWMSCVAKPAAWRWILMGIFNYCSDISIDKHLYMLWSFQLSTAALCLLLPCFSVCECPFKALHHPLCSFFFFPQHISQCSAFSAQRQLVNSPVYNTATSWSTMPWLSAKQPTHLSGPCLVCHDAWHHASHLPDQITVHHCNDFSFHYHMAFIPNFLWYQENRCKCFVFIINPLWADWMLLVWCCSVCWVCCCAI